VIHYNGAVAGRGRGHRLQGVGLVWLRCRAHQLDRDKLEDGGLQSTGSAAAATSKVTVRQERTMPACDPTPVRWAVAVYDPENM